MKRTGTIVSVIAAAVLVCILAGCSADALMETGKNLGSLRYATADNGGDEIMKDAVKSVDGFIERYESLLDWDKWAAGDGKRYINDKGEEKVDGELTLRKDIDAWTEFSKLMEELTDNILAAKDTSSSDKELKAALNTLYKDYDGKTKKYKGHAVDWYSHRSMRQVINVVTTVSSITGVVLPTGSDTIEKLYAYDSPFPVQGSEICFIASEALYTLLPKMGSYLMDFIQKVTTKPSGGGGEGGGSSFNISDYKYILDNMSASVGNRKDATVGDKIVMCMVMDIVRMTVDGLTKYADTHPGSGAERFDDLNAEWILGNCCGSLDRIYAELEVIGYIYDCNIDLAGIAGKLL